LTEVLENIFVEYYKLQGYFVVVREPVPGSSNRGIPDLDIIACRRLPRDRGHEVILVECKGWGSPESYSNFNTSKRSESVIEKIIERIKVWDTYVHSQNNKYGLKDTELKKFVIIIPGVISDTTRSKIKNEVILRLGRNERLKKYANIEIEIKSIHEMLLELIAEIAKDMYSRRKRYENPALELIRWLIRITRSRGWDVQKNFLDPLRKILLGKP